ncbi:hypothetical protein [Roseobacter weihaiensis]|uniref:hypothetical protein n=1 Tax=Roseobacter weihaiensis TaxID=2763262 RepID=UPI001D0A645B|nr:hypothetical protein [Roseobacter sp. H9]
MRFALICLCVFGVAACTGPQNANLRHSSKPADPPAETTGVTFSGYARYGIVKGN